MAISRFRSTGIIEAIKSAKDMAEKVEKPFKEVECKTCFYYKHMKRRHNSFFFSFLISIFLNHPSPPNATQPYYGIINLIIFLRFSLYGFYSGEKITDNNFSRC